MAAHSSDLFKLGVETADLKDWDGLVTSNGEATSLATLRMDLIPRSMRPVQSRALSSEPNQMPGMI